jgi:hypothetical protein
MLPTKFGQAFAEEKIFLEIDQQETSITVSTAH